MTYPPAIKNITAGKLIRALIRDGFYKYGKVTYVHPDGRRVVIHYHRSGQTFPRGTLQAILQETRWTTDDLKRLKLIK